MTLHKQKFREIVLQLLYGLDLADQSQEELQALLSQELEVSKTYLREAQLRVNEIRKVIPVLDKLITKTSQSYQFDRIPSVERNILRLGLYELIYDDSIPPKVAIAEAMRLSRKFSSPESAAFINALMDALYKEKQGEAIDPQKMDETAKTLEESYEKNQEIIDQAQKDNE